MPTLAQISLDMLGPIAPWLVSASAVVFLVNQAITFWKEHLREQPTPADTYATIAALKDVEKQAHGRMNREKAERDIAVAERKKARDEELAAMKEATRALSKKVEDEVAEMRRLVEAREKSGEDRANRINDRIDALSKAVGEMPDRLFTLIRNAKTL